MHKDNQPLIFELTREGRVGYSLPELDVPELDLSGLLPEGFIREEAAELPEVSELDIMRHYTALSNRNHGIDSGFYPLGSCTMKYNPKINESVARYPGFANIHPLQDESTVQGAMELMYDLQEHLVEITGMDEVTLTTRSGSSRGMDSTNDDSCIPRSEWRLQTYESTRSGLRSWNEPCFCSSCRLRFGDCEIE